MIENQHDSIRDTESNLTPEELERRRRQQLAALQSTTAPASEKHWRDVFGVGDASTTATAVDAVYRTLAAKHHPDHPGGSHEAMTELNAARDQAMRELA